MRDHLSNMLGCSSELIQFRFYEILVDPQKTPKDYEMQNDDVLTASILDKPPSQSESASKTNATHSTYFFASPLPSFQEMGVLN